MNDEERSARLIALCQREAAIWLEVQTAEKTSLPMALYAATDELLENYREQRELCLQVLDPRDTLVYSIEALIIMLEGTKQAVAARL